MAGEQQKAGWLTRAAATCARLLVIAAFLALLGWLFSRFTWVVISMLVALLAASVLTPPVRWLSGRGLKRGLASLLVEFAAVVAVGGLFTFVVPPMVQQLSQRGGELAGRLRDTLEQALRVLPVGPQSLEALGQRALETLRGRAGPLVSGVASGVATLGEVFAGILLTLVLLFFMLRDGPQLADWLIERASPRAWRQDVRAMAERSWGTLRGYFRGVVIVALVDAVGIGLGLLLIGVPLVLPLSLFVFFGAFIPIVGAFLTGLLAVLVALASGGVVDALLVLGVVLLVQQLEGNVLEPLVMGRAVPLHPIVILLAVTLGGILAGIAGAFVSVPLAAMASAAGNELRRRHAPA